MSQTRSVTKSENSRNGNQSNKTQSGCRRYRSKNRNSKTNNGSTSKGNNQPSKPTVRELKYHMHGTEAHRKAETFEKIKDDIIS